MNHPDRGETFVTRKITRAVANILKGKQRKLYLGNIDAKRDWGFAPEYVEMMWLMLQQEVPDDYAVGTGESHSVKDFLEKAFGYAGIEIEWRGQGIDRKGVVKSVASPRLNPALGVGDILIEIDPKYFRPTEVDFLQADISKARKKLGWKPRTTFEELVKIMVDYDMKLIGLPPVGEGIEI